MRISIDLDGVVANFVQRVREIANLPANYEPPDWDFSDVFEKEDWRKLFGTIRARKNFWANMPVYTENVQALRSFLSSESGHDIYYVTSRLTTAGDSVSLQTENWLAINNLLATDNFWSVVAVDDASKKHIVIDALNIEASVDDYGPTVKQCSEIPSHRAYLLDRPWNCNNSCGTRIYSLEEFFNQITGKKPEETHVQSSQR